MQFKFGGNLITFGIGAFFFIGTIIYNIIQEKRKDKKEKEKEEEFNKAIRNLSDEDKKELRKEAINEYLKVKPDRINNILKNTKTD